MQTIKENVTQRLEHLRRETLENVAFSGKNHPKNMWAVTRRLRRLGLLQQSYKILFLFPHHSRVLFLARAQVQTCARVSEASRPLSLFSLFSLICLESCFMTSSDLVPWCGGTQYREEFNRWLSWFTLISRSSSMPTNKRDCQEEKKLAKIKREREKKRKNRKGH